MATLKIDGFDIWTYTRVAAGEGLDISDTDFRDPQFGDGGLGLGDPLLSVRQHNREISIPVHIRASGTTKDTLHTTVSDLNRRLAVAKQLEWRDDNATNSTFLNIKFARFEPEFNKRRQDALWMTGTVRLYTEPYGRSVASGYAYTTGSFAGTGVVASIAIASYLLGDAPVTMKVEVNTPSTIQPITHGRVIGAAVLPASYVADWSAASIVRIGSTYLNGASGTIGSQVVAHSSLSDYSTAGASYWLPREFAQIILTNASAYAGNNRVVCIANSTEEVPIVLNGNQGTPTSAPWQGMGLVDLGVVNIDPNAGATYVLSFATAEHTKEYYTTLSLNASSPLELNRVLLLPEDTSCFVIDDSRRRPLALVEGGALATVSILPPVYVDSYGNAVSPTAAFGTAASQYFYKSGGDLVINSGANFSKMQIAATSANVSGQAYGNLATSVTTVEIGKHTTIGDWFVRYAGINATLAYLAVSFVNTGGTASTVASVGFNRNYLAFTATTSPWDSFTLRMQQQGPVIRGEVTSYTNTETGRSVGAASVIVASISASVAAVAQAGTPLVSANLAAQFTKVSFTEVASTGLNPGDVYSIAYDEKLAQRSNSIKYDVGYGLRGDLLSFVPEPSKYMAAIALNLPLDRSGTITDAWSARLSFNDHFTYAK